MERNTTVIQRFDTIRDNITNDQNIIYTAVLEDVKSVFRDFRYKKRYYNHSTAGLIRSSQNIDQTWFNDVGKLSYPPAHILTNFGRCNCPYEPIFYCSNENIVSIYEVRPELNNFLVVSVWKSKLSKNINFLTLSVGTQTIIEHLDDSDPLKIALKQDDYFRDDTEQYVKDIDEYIGRVFIEDADDEKLYLFTYAVTWCLLNLSYPKTGRKIDGIMYPSVANNLEGFNLALTTKFVDDNIILEKAGMYKIVGSEKPTYKLDLVNVLDTLVEEDSSLNRREIKPSGIFIVSDEKNYPTIDVLPYEGIL